MDVFNNAFSQTPGPVDYPNPSDVRQGVAYGNSGFVGTLVVGAGCDYPATSDVRSGVAYGGGVGMLEVSAAQLSPYPQDANHQEVIRGDDYDGTAHEPLKWTVEKDFQGWSGAMTIRHRVTQAVLMDSVAIEVNSPTELQAVLTKSNTAFALLTTDRDFGVHPYDVQMKSPSGSTFSIRGIVTIQRDQTTT